MKTKIIIICTFLTLIFTTIESIQGQNTYKFNRENSSIVIKGTSNVHDWEEVVKSFTCEMKVSGSTNDVHTIEWARVTCDSKSISSGKSIMDSKTKEALKADKYPKIQFEVITIENITKTNEIITGKAVGNLTLAGITRKIIVPFTGSTKTGVFQISGHKALLLRDYGIVPPTALMGALQTGEEVTINFNLTFNKQLISNI